MKEEMKRCTKCGEEKEVSKFEKGKGGKHTSRCRKCAANYASNRIKGITKNREKENKGLSKDQNIKDNPLFEMELVAEHVANVKVQRTQMVVLPGNVDKFLKVTCQCGILINLEYKYSYDSENDYYEGVCSTCKRSFKQTITNPH